MVLKFLLISDGSSDSALIPIIKFALKTKFKGDDFIGERADLYRVPNPPKSLRDKILLGKELYNPDLILVHRDCEKDTVQKRHDEIDEAIIDLEIENIIKIVPLRMTEAWLMIDEMAIRLAVNNPNGNVRLMLPPINKLEGIVDPKQSLETLLKIASELKGRRLDSLNTRQAIHYVADHIKDFSSLNKLSSFNYFSNQLELLNFE